MKKLYTLPFIIIFMAACGTNSTIFSFPLERDEIAQRINNSPHVNLLVDHPLEITHKSNEITLYYKHFNWLTSPSVIIDWETYYVLGEPSSPDWDYDKIAKLEIYLPYANDEKGLMVMKEKASELGGSSIIDVYKKPLRSPGTTRELSRTYDSATYQTPIEAYLYYGIVVIKK